MGRITRGIKKVVKPMVNVPAWLGWKSVRGSTSAVSNLAKSIFVPKPKMPEEGFDEAVERLGLTPQQLQQRIKEFQNLAFLFAILTLGIFTYFLYLVLEGSWRGAIVCGGVTFISLSMFVRFHFWLYQIQQRKLGCSLREWFWHGLLGR